MQKCCVAYKEDDTYHKFMMSSDDIIDLRGMLERHHPGRPFADCNECANKLACLVGGATGAVTFERAQQFAENKPTL